MPPQSDNNQNPDQPLPQPDNNQPPADDDSAPAPAPAAQPTVQQTVAPSFSPQTYSQTPAQPTMAYGTNPAAQTNGGGGSLVRKRRLPVMLLVVIGSAVVLLGGSAAAYFGYYMSPSVVWKDSLSNTGKGYSQLVSYLNTQSNAHYNGIKEDGSFQVDAGGANYSGSVTGQSYGESSTASLKLDLGLTNLDVETRSVPVAGTKDPDIYLQVSGIKDFSNFLGPDLGPKVANLDGQWIVVDHNLIADLEQQVASSQSSSKTPLLKWSDIHNFLVAAGTLNQKYLFSTDPKTSVTTVVKTYGKETIDGHKTIHYKVGFVKANVKAYVTAMCDALGQGGLGTFLKQETGGKAVSDSDTCKNLEQSTNSIKPSDTIDVWADTSHRILYKVRVNTAASSPAENFVDIGLNYTGGTTYPFFISGQDKSSGNSDTFSVVATLDGTANTLKAVVKDTSTGDSPLTLNGTFMLAPSNQKLTVTAPVNAKSMLDVLNSLGLSQLLNSYTQALSAGSAGGLPTDTPFSSPDISL